MYKGANSPPVPKEFDKKIVLSIATGTSATIQVSELATDPDGDVLRAIGMSYLLNGIVNCKNGQDNVVITAGSKSGQTNVTIIVSDPENHLIEIVIPVTVEK